MLKIPCAWICEFSGTPGAWICEFSGTPGAVDICECSGTPGAVDNCITEPLVIGLSNDIKLFGIRITNIYALFGAFPYIAWEPCNLIPPIFEKVNISGLFPVFSPCGALS